MTQHQPAAVPTSRAGPERPAAAPATVVAVEQARLRDLLAVSRLQRRAFPPRLAYGLTTLGALWLLPWMRFLVARERVTGRLVGCAIGDRQRGHARVINLAVDPDAQRRRIGTRLLRALEVALPHGNVILMVEETNPAARALYAREGYTETGTARHYYGYNQHGIWMQKRRTDHDTPRIWC